MTKYTPEFPHTVVIHSDPLRQEECRQSEMAHEIAKNSNIDSDVHFRGVLVAVFSLGYPPTFSSTEEGTEYRRNINVYSTQYNKVE